MLDNLKSKVSQLMNKQEKSLDQDVLNLLNTIVEPLKEIDAALPSQVLDYIVNGEHPEVLLSLQQRNDDFACALLGSPGTYGWFWPSATINKAQVKLVKASQNAAYKLYIRIFSSLSHAQIIRYGSFLAAATQQRNCAELSKQTPAWFAYVLIDGLLRSFDSQGFAKHQTRSHRAIWTFDALKQLYLAEADNSFDDFIATLFERNGVERYHYDKLNVLFNLSDCVEFFTEHKAQIQNIIPKLSAVGQSIFLTLITEHQALIPHYAELVVILSLSNSKTVREQAVVLLTHIDEAESQQYLQHFLLNGVTKQRAFAAELLARLGEKNREILQQAMDVEQVKSVQMTITTALQRLETVGQAEESHFDLADIVPIETQPIPESFIPIIVENYQALLEKAKQSAEQEIEDNKTASYKSDWRQKDYKEWQRIKIDTLSKKLLDALNGQEKMIIAGQNARILTYQNKLQNYDEFNLVHALRLCHHNGSSWVDWSELFGRLLKPHQYATLELRQLEQQMQKIGFEQPARTIAGCYLESWYGETVENFINEDQQIIPFFMEHLDFISEALGLLPDQSVSRYRQFEALYAIQILQRFPQLPKQFIPRLLEFALGDGKSLRFDAQEVLKKLPDIHLRAIEALANGKQEIRVTAIEWLVRLGHQDAIAALYNLLKKEKKEIVIAAALTALEQLGEDIQDYLSAENLLKDAEKGLKAKVASSFTWFNLQALPPVQWQDGSAVDPKIIQWWVVLADKLKDPTPNSLLQRYMSLLNEKSQQTLALHLLHSFIEQDTRHPSVEEALAIATQDAPRRLAQYQDSFRRWGSKYPEFYGRYEHITLEEVIEEIKRERLAIYLGSAIKSKGMLALTFKVQGSVAVKLLQNYMKQHYQRRAQIEAMLSSFAVSDDPLIIQLLLGLSRRYRTASVQNLAKQLVEQIAERNHWTSDELADRTIPTAGLDDTGVLTLEYGSRVLTAYVDEKDKFVLKNEDGKVIKSLPAARQGDDESLIKEAKSLFSSSKKEFKQVLDLQTQRLYEAMCSERAWSCTDWQEYILAHPIMQRLIQRLVWLEVSADGEILQSFRPSDDGSLLNLDDDEIELASDSQIKIAHVVLLSAEDAEAWQTHFKDYKVKFLFEQMTHTLPTFDTHAELLEDRKGWLTDTFTLRGVITKLGYKRASIEDGGSFDSYFKPFSQIGLSAVVRFSGSYVPEENLAAVLYDLSFERNNVRSWRDSAMNLADVPPVLLAEAYADYLKVAEACSGFDPDWEKKTPW